MASQIVEENASSHSIQTPQIDSIAALLPNAPSATHGSSLVIHKGKKWVKDLTAALEQLHASSGNVLCGLCRWDARCGFAHVTEVVLTVA
jgi:hypothetical protein